ncbi:MAG: IPTL-CTERM sorting domain-containing protein [Gammaproteobacteria bacterium]
MTASGNFAPGGTVTFTVAITNSGTGDQANNPGPEFTDTLPPELILQSATLKASGSLNVDVPTNTVTWDGPLPAGATDRFDIVAQIRGNVGLGAVISNQGTLNFDSDGDGTNDATALTDDPATPTGNDATLITLAAAIPTLSFWAMLALALGVLAAVTYRQRRRLGA